MSGPERRRGFSAVRDLPALCWLLATLVVAVLTVSSRPWLPAPGWLMIHLLLLGAATHSVLVWSRHFADALLHTAPRSGDRATRNCRLVLVNLGVLLVLIGVPTATWMVVAVGAAAVVAAVGWHAVSLVTQLRRALPSRFGTTVHYYVAAAGLLPLGVLFGVLMARGLTESAHMRVMVAHAIVNVFGWLGLTVLGTLVTLWPTMLRTRIASGAERAARIALPILLGGLLVATGGALAGLRPVVGLGLAGYLAGIGVLARPFVAAARAKPPVHFPTLSVSAGVCWLAGTVAALAVGVGAASSWQAAHELLERLAPALAAGFGAQVLLGAMSYLLPVAVGGGPSVTRAANVELDRGAALRVAVVNGGLLVALLPVPDLVRLAAWVLVAAALAAFLPLLVSSLRASRSARAATAATPDGPVGPRRRGPTSPGAERPPGQASGLAATGLAAVVLAVAVGVAANPSALAGGTPSVPTGRAAAAAPTDAARAAEPTGHTTRVSVTAADFHFSPSTVEVPAGDRLVVELHNGAPDMTHDLVLENGATSGLLSPGQSGRLDAGIVTHDLDGWCSIPGHRQLGMVFHIKVTDGSSQRSGGPAHSQSPMPGMAMPKVAQADPHGSAPELAPRPAPGFAAHDATLPPSPAGHLHRRTFTIEEPTRPVAPGVRAHLWTYNGQAPGPVLHGRVGDRFVIRVVNNGTMAHSIDFHAGEVAPNRSMRDLAPGQSLVYRFTAGRSGIWMYHCATAPMAAHIANGMFGAVVIDPPGLRNVAHSYVLIQSELYLGGQGKPVDVDKVAADRPDAVVFNGYADQYSFEPLRARTGQRIRVWVLDAGPTRSTSFHVVGTQFDTVFKEGAYLLRGGNPEHGGSQALELAPAQGGFVEFTFPAPGHYPFLSHVMVDAERGAHGIFAVTR